MTHLTDTQTTHPTLPVIDTTLSDRLARAICQAWVVDGVRDLERRVWAAERASDDLETSRSEWRSRTGKLDAAMTAVYEHLQDHGSIDQQTFVRLSVECLDRHVPRHPAAKGGEE